ncbi:hypothetical protein Fcan01_15600 [Folsomia candida]|uniref:Uncharacterized protein n=1 Tax=Folsomia candida TaxID=158441 RepID=A0A226DYH1_FOLCA|nr:hypothetical protein Fcan01_15600 [Folsomia candida]
MVNLRLRRSPGRPRRGLFSQRPGPLRGPALGKTPTWQPLVRALYNYHRHNNPSFLSFLNIHELFGEFGFKLHSPHITKNLTRLRLSIRKDLPSSGNYIWEGEIPAELIHTQFPAAAIFADRIAFQPTSHNVQTVLYALKNRYPNVTCNIFISSNGLFQLYEGLWKFVDESDARNQPAPLPESIGALENHFVAFQLYLLFGGFAILMFFAEIIISNVQ